MQRPHALHPNLYVSPGTATGGPSLRGLLVLAIPDTAFQPADLTSPKNRLDSRDVVINADDAVPVGVDLGIPSGIKLSGETEPFHLLPDYAILLDRPNLRDAPVTYPLTQALKLGTENTRIGGRQVIVDEYLDWQSWEVLGGVGAAPCLLVPD
ncbi:MAG: hypothetical protein ACRD0P_22995, partial [Stackebrandtia sp.]